MTTSQQAICETIWAQTLTQSSLDEDAKSCLARIKTETTAARDEITAALMAEGVTVLRTELKPQFHAFDLHLSGHDVPAALRVAAQDGFVLAKAFRAGAATALTRFADHLPLMKRGAHTLRMTLIWHDTSPLSLPKRLTPKLVDYSFAALPKWAWWAYPFVKPLRIFRERLSGSKFEDQLDGFLAQVNLGTPNALLTPLCEFGQIGPDDILLDLGCGDARFLIDAVRKTGCRGIGVERNLPLAQRGQDAIDAAGLTQHITLHARLATLQDLAQATVIFMFQPPGTLRALLPWVLRARPPKARVLIHEQAGVHFDTPPDEMRPLFGDNALTVGHLWQASQGDQ